MTGAMAAVGKVPSVDGVPDTEGAEPCTVRMPARELAEVYRRLEAQPLIEQATGIVIGFYGVSAEQAREWLLEWAEEHRVPLSCAAAVLVDGCQSGSQNLIEPSQLVRRGLAGVGNDVPPRSGALLWP